MWESYHGKQIARRRASLPMWNTIGRGAGSVSGFLAIRRGTRAYPFCFAKWRSRHPCCLDRQSSLEESRSDALSSGLAHPATEGCIWSRFARTLSGPTLKRQRAQRVHISGLVFHSPLSHKRLTNLAPLLTLFFRLTERAALPRRSFSRSSVRLPVNPKMLQIPAGFRSVRATTVHSGPPCS